jgi:hypothetical protein
VDVANSTILLALVHAIIFLLAVGYAQNYYFHLRKLFSTVSLRDPLDAWSDTVAGHHKNNAH